MKILFLVALIFIVLDFITGIAQACYNKTFASSKMREGLWHKAGELFVILLAAICEYTFPMIGLDIAAPMVPVVVGYICLMELASIMENIATINPDLAKLLTHLFGPYVQKKLEGKKNEVKF